MNHRAKTNVNTVVTPTPRWSANHERVRWIEELPTKTQEACGAFLEGRLSAPPAMLLNRAELLRMADQCRIQDRVYGILKFQCHRYIVRAEDGGGLRAGPVGQITFPPYDALQTLLSDSGRGRDGTDLELLRRLYSEVTNRECQLETSDGCPLCASFAPDDPPPGAQVVQCIRCGVLHRPKPTDWSLTYKDKRGEYFQTILGRSQCYGAGHGYEDYEEWCRVILGAAHFDNRAAWIETVTGQRAGTALDVGCAMGDLSAALVRRGWRARGVDLSPYCVNRALSLCAGGQFTIGTINESAWPPVNVITYCDVFEHLADPLAELANIRRVLQPHGWLILELPNQHSADAYILGADYLFEEHLFYYGPAQITALLNANGFQVRSIATAHDPYFRVDRLISAEMAAQLLVDIRGERLLVAARLQ